MANKSLFKSSKTPASKKLNTNNWVESTNNAGGAAFSFPDKLALAQFAVTGTFSNTFYTDAETQLAKVKELALKVDSVFLAKLAVYSRESAFMKDMPAFLLAVLHGRGETALLATVFPRVVNSFKMLSNFMQIVRSGAVGRKSFGSTTKRIIQNWLDNKTALEVFNGSIGLSDPSVADMIKMVHPKADGEAKNAVFAYITESKGYIEKMGNLPEEIQLFEKLKKGEATQVPNIPFRALTNIDLNEAQWRSIAANMPFNTLRQNLNMLAKRGVFKAQAAVDEAVAKLSNPDIVRKVKVFPYQLFTAYLNVDAELPIEIKNALQDAAEVATENVPSFGGKVVVALDVSGSMSSSVMGFRPGVPASKMRTIDVASLVASTILRQNKNARVIPFDTRVHSVSLNPRDSIMTNAATLAKFGGGGTNCALPLAQLNSENANADLVIYVSDNESWHGGRYGTAEQWSTFKRRNPKAKLVNIDVQASAHSQVPDTKDVLNIGGFSDVIWTVIEKFASNESKDDFVKAIENSVEI